VALNAGMAVVTIAAPRSFRLWAWETTGHAVALTRDEEVNVSIPSMADGTETTTVRNFYRLP